MLTIHRNLRSATAEAHRNLEASLALLTDDVSRADYVGYLRGMYGFHAPVEERLQTHPEALAACEDLRERARVHLLQQDLDALDAFSPPPPRAQHLPAMQSLPQMLGVAYVFEGSTLGGQVLSRELAHRLQLPPEALSYLTAYGPDTGPRFRAFMQTLARCCSEPCAESELVASAIQTFNLLQDWLTKVA